MSMPDIGVIIFHELGGGWASYEGRNPVHIEGLKDIPLDRVWITNLSFGEMRELGFNGNPNFRNDTFLGTSMKSLMKEYDITEDMDPAKSAQTMSRVIHRVVYAAHKHTGLTELGPTLVSSIQKKIGIPFRVAGNSSTVNDAIENSIQPYQKCTGQSPKGLAWYTLKYPRNIYAATLTSFRHPAGKWNKLYSNEVDEQWLKDNILKKPVLCKIKIKSYKSDLAAELMPFGFNAGSSSSRRFWATGHETLALFHEANVEVEEVLIADRFEDSFSVFPCVGNENDISMSVGLFAECWWKAVSSSKSSYGAWITSWDRLLCLKAAAYIAASGVKVMGFGSGAVHVAPFPDQIKDLIELSISKIDMNPPLNMIRHMNINV